MCLFELTHRLSAGALCAWCVWLAIGDSALREWLRMYKSQAGIINEFAFNGECKSRAYAEGVVEETHNFWKALIQVRRCDDRGCLRLLVGGPPLVHV